MKSYSKKVLKHFQNPKNLGNMKKPDGIGQVGNLVCGDLMKMYIRVGLNKKKEEIIRDIKFETFGCVAALATSSVTTEMAKGKTLGKALRIDREKIVKSLGGLPAIKTHCSILASDALAEAIHNYLSRNGRNIPKNLELKHKRIKKEVELIKKRHNNLEKKESKNAKKTKK
jgi:nitrogen fixation NifU-like protein